MNHQILSNTDLNIGTSLIKMNNSLTENQINEVLSKCYNFYKKEYTHDRDFSINSEDINEELDEIINEYDSKLKRRNEILSNSIYSDLLDEFEVVIYNNSSHELSFETLLEDKNFKKEKQTRKFSDIYKFPRNLEIRTDEETDEIIEPIKDIKHPEKDQYDNLNNDKRSDVSIEIEAEVQKNGVKPNTSKNTDLKFKPQDSFNLIMVTEDYQLSQSNLKHDDRSTSMFYRERGSEILSQANILIDSQISQNALNHSMVISNILFKDENDELTGFQSKTFTEEKILSYRNKARSINNESIDMSVFCKKELQQFEKILPLDLPNLDNLHNSKNQNHSEENFINQDYKDLNQVNNNSNSEISYSPKFLSDLNPSNSIVDENITKMMIIEQYFATIHNHKSINIKNYYFSAIVNYKDIKVDDPFLEQFFNLLNKENFFNEELCQELKHQYNNRFEIYFFEICRKYLQLKKEAFCAIDSKSISIFKNNLLKLLDEMSKLLNNQIFLTSSDEYFIFKPIILYKLWDNSSEDLDISSYHEIIKLFKIKTLLKKSREMKVLIKTFHHVKIVLNYENSFDKSQVFLYYFGKLTALFVENIQNLTEDEILKLLSLETNVKEENFKKIKKILLGYGYPNSYNFKKKSKNYENLAKISEYFKDDPKKIESYWKKSKRYFEFYNDPNKLTLTKESGMSVNSHGTGRESFGSI